MKQGTKSSAAGNRSTTKCSGQPLKSEDIISDQQSIRILVPVGRSVRKAFLVQRATAHATREEFAWTKNSPAQAYQFFHAGTLSAQSFVATLLLVGEQKVTEQISRVTEDLSLFLALEPFLW